MKFNIITDVYVTPGNVHDSVPYLNTTCMGGAKEKIKLNRLSKSGKMLYKFRKEKIERSFAD